MITQLKELRSHKGFIALVSARFISNLGNGLSPIALAYGVLSIPGADGKDLSLVMAARFVPMVALMLFGGVVGDRYKRNRVVGGADIIGSVFVTISATSFLGHFPSVWLLAVMGAIFGVLNALWWPAMVGVLPEILPKDKLKDGNAVVAFSSNIGFVLGALLGGTLVTLYGSGWALLIDAISFLIAGILVWNLDLPEMPEREENSVIHDLRIGWHEFISRPWVIAIVCSFAIINMCFEAIWQVLGPLAYDQGDSGPRNWSFNLAAVTLGMIFGSVIALKIKLKRPLVTSMILIAASSVWNFAIASTQPLALVMVCGFVSGLAIDIFMVQWNTAMQTHIPEESFSRVAAYDAFGSFGIAPIGVAFAGPAAAYFGITPTLWATGILTFIAALASLSVKSLRALK
ncbi:MAG: MFS transporter [Actinobacteria bacterium]|nr:MFS transporter [Actinomycetota bacterium]NDA95200.1 MFS transporter [Actinomycetota bacterium]NDH80819.1 MFS transporter [Actinomycetota bacterium]